MPRPKRYRRVEQFPQVNYFMPAGVPSCQLEEVSLTVEEFEAMRLKDLEGLSQEACAQKMDISRQTFQLIIDSARQKIAEALLEGKAIAIRGGHYTTRQCQFVCETCGKVYEIESDGDHKICPECGSTAVKCMKKTNFCKTWCNMSSNEVLNAGALNSDNIKK